MYLLKNISFLNFGIRVPSVLIDTKSSKLVKNGQNREDFLTHIIDQMGYFKGHKS